MQPTPQTSSTGATLWRVAQWLGVVVTLIVIAALIVTPEPTLNVLWNAIIPVLPASFLITPILWRSVCPLATLNMVSNGIVSRRSLSIAVASNVGLAAIILLGVMVPARRFLFNEQGLVLAVVVLVIAGAAAVLGAIFDAKAGFCNSICPVLPVEKLYGQHPLVDIKNPRCAPCTLCTARGCVDLVPEKSITQAMRSKASRGRWLLTHYGVFAASFPGFIVGYFTTTNVPLSGWASIYGHIAQYAVASYLIVAAVVVATRISSSLSLTLLAALAVGLYYWYAAPSIMESFGAPSWPAVALRAASLGLVAFWLYRALRRPRKTLLQPTMAANTVQATLEPTRHTSS